MPQAGINDDSGYNEPPAGRISGLSVVPGSAFFREAIGVYEMTAEWRDKLENEQAHACCEQGLWGATVVIAGNCVHLQSIIHECHHAVNWMAALGVIDGREEEAHYCGLWAEEIIASLLRAGWRHTTKTSEGSLWNRDVLVALCPPNKVDMAKRDQ